MMSRISFSLKVERRARQGFEAECFESQARGGPRSGSGEGEAWLAKPTKSASDTFRTMNALSLSEGQEN